MPCTTNLRGSSLVDRCLERKYRIGFPQAFQEVEKSKVARQSQLGEFQNFPASVIPSQLSAPQTAARSEDPLGHERVDGPPMEQLSLPDRALLRKCSIPALHDGLPSAADKTKVQSERDGYTLREEEPQPIVEQVSMKPSEKELSMVSVTGTE